MTAVVRTLGDDLCWRPRVHTLVTRGGWDRADQWVPVPFVDGEAAALLFRHKVSTLLQRERVLSEERARRLLSWRYSGFSVRTCVTLSQHDRDALEPLARYLLGSPVSLERLQLDEQAQAIAYAARIRPGHEPQATSTAVSPKDFLARVVMHIREPRHHVIRYYGRLLQRRADAPPAHGARGCRPSNRATTAHRLTHWRPSPA